MNFDSKNRKSSDSAAEESHSLRSSPAPWAAVGDWSLRSAADSAGIHRDSASPAIRLGCPISAAREAAPSPDSKAGRGTHCRNPSRASSRRRSWARIGIATGPSSSVAGDAEGEARERDPEKHDDDDDAAVEDPTPSQKTVEKIPEFSLLGA